MRCPRCGAVGVDAQGLCLRCRQFVGAPVGPPRPQRNPLLIPGIIFAVVAVLLIGAVIVYAATGGDEPAGTAQDAPGAATTSGAGSDPAATATGSAAPSGPAEQSAGPSASPAPSADTCIVGVWFEERHDETVTVPNTGAFPVHGSGTYQRYSETGRVTFDHGSGVRLYGTIGSTRHEFVYTGFAMYTYRVENGQVIYSNPRAQGTETLYRDGKQVYTAPLQAREIPPRKFNCGSVAMSLSGPDLTLELKRTSSR
ncbi:hypothetical protein AB0H83_14085 [Dactylosporangium sp. NPDC050688]|uniref:hypothetical protein n=1 Tax=Dactylosporangium sp. NPDC050688 TaxID=3157217 RepID=UPI0033FF33EF